MPEVGATLEWDDIVNTSTTGSAGVVTSQQSIATASTVGPLGEKFEFGLRGGPRLSTLVEGESWAVSATNGSTYFVEYDETRNQFSVSQASINAVTAAASLAASFSTGGTTIAVSGAGALGSNIVLSDTRAFIEESAIVSKRDVLIEADNSSGIAAVTGALAGSVAIGSSTSVGVSIGAAVAFN